MRETNIRDRRWTIWDCFRNLQETWFFYFIQAREYFYQLKLLRKNLQRAANFQFSNWNSEWFLLHKLGKLSCLLIKEAIESFVFNGCWFSTYRYIWCQRFEARPKWPLKRINIGAVGRPYVSAEVKQVYRRNVIYSFHAINCLQSVPLRYKIFSCVPIEGNAVFYLIRWSLTRPYFTRPRMALIWGKISLSAIVNSLNSKFNAWMQI